MTDLKKFFQYSTGSGALNISVGTNDPEKKAPEKAEHVLKTDMPAAEIITMDQWLAKPLGKRIGSFWVCDTTDIADGGGRIVKSLGNDVDIIQLGRFMNGANVLHVSTKPYSKKYNSAWHHGAVIADSRVGASNLETLPDGNYIGAEYSFGATPMTTDGKVDTTKALQWVRIEDGSKYMYICDRNLLANISWEMIEGMSSAGIPLGAKNYATGASTEFTYPGTDIKHTVNLRLLTGGTANKSGIDDGNNISGLGWHQ